MMKTIFKSILFSIFSVSLVQATNNFVPRSTNTTSTLGTPVKRWAGVHTNTITFIDQTTQTTAFKGYSSTESWSAGQTFSSITLPANAVLPEDLNAVDSPANAE